MSDDRQFGKQQISAGVAMLNKSFAAENVQVSREKYWDEMDQEQRIQKLRQVVSSMERQLWDQRRIIDLLLGHMHGVDGKLMSPLSIHSDPHREVYNSLK